MTVDVLVLLAAGVAIYFSCEGFVNGIEWLGRRLGISEQATGTLLAAIGTALPESVITFVALGLSTGPADTQIGIGAALGGPLALATIAYAVVGVALILRQRRSRHKSPHPLPELRWLVRAQAWFLAVFAAKIGLGVVAFPHKAVAGLAFLLLYAWFFVSELGRGGGGELEPHGPLMIHRRSAHPALGWILFQTLAALTAVFVASRIFVDRLGDVAMGLGLPPGAVSLFLSPVATELPEMANALIWVRQGKVRLAMANISGAMMIQATVPTAFGLLFSPWLLDRVSLLSAAATACAMAMLLILFWRRAASGLALAQAAWFYAAFVAAVVWLG